jgi:hypothetical protein
VEAVWGGAAAVVVLAVFGLRKKGMAAGLCWVELETVRRKWKASVQRAGLGCRCWRLMWVWPWLVFVRGSCCGTALVISSAFSRPKGGRWLVVSGWWRWVKEKKPTGPSWGGQRSSSTGKGKLRLRGEDLEGEGRLEKEMARGGTG